MQQQFNSTMELMAGQLFCNIVMAQDKHTKQKYPEVYHSSDFNGVCSHQQMLCAKDLFNALSNIDSN